MGEAGVPNYDDNERLIRTGDAALTVEILGAGERWGFTNADIPLMAADGRGYEPVPLQMSNITADAAMGGNQIDITLPRWSPVAGRFFPVATKTIYKVIVRQAAHADGAISDDPLMFTGVITAAAITGDEGEMLRLKASTQMGLLERSGLRRRYQLQCPYVLFGPECRASKAASQFPANIEVPPSTAWGDVYITVHGESADEPWLWRGRDMRVWEGRVFMIGATVNFAGVDYEIADVIRNYGSNTIRVRVMPDQVQALRAAVEAAQPVDRVCVVTPACDHTVACCNDLFSNGVNFGGQPWIPYENPVKKIFVGT
ncbi:phage BR0599 family protein [Paracoccus sanguinis]|uniref:Bacteriophage phiJL001 Gp84 C-terminal domain-containing protein n=1 Tax=Paracoccus sanguinis TaxID=1545044 RepID=A0A099GMI3_9RHOB|nr:phage BR0599 family protein [Paracoccus sanguinis]KGJ23757.1 hypothetical protein IX56_00325 [Paracoccus sanguinis]